MVEVEYKVSCCAQAQTQETKPVRLCKQDAGGRLPKSAHCCGITSTNRTGRSLVRDPIWTRVYNRRLEGNFRHITAKKPNSQRYVILPLHMCHVIQLVPNDSY